MIRQRVDFHRPRFRPRRDFLAARNLFALAVFLLLLSLASHLWLVAALQRQRAGLPVMADRFSAAHISAMTAENLCRQELLTFLEAGPGGETTAFSALLRGFSQGARPGLWLTGVDLFDGGREMVVRGRVLANGPERVATYARDLSRLPVFARRRIRFYQVIGSTDETDRSGRLTFCLETRPVKKKGAGKDDRPGCERSRRPAVAND